MKIRQINLNKSTIALSALTKYLCNDTLDTVYLIQEVYWFKNRIPGLPQWYTFYGTPNSRAVIVAPKFFPLFLVADHTHPDQTVCQYVHESDKRLFVSLYLDGKERNPINPNMDKLLDFISNTNSSAILGLDSNSHSVWWGSPNSDA